MNRLVAVFELDPIPTQAEPLRFRIELFRSVSRGRFHARLFRWEIFRLAPLSSDVEHSDEVVVVEDSFWDWTQQHAESETQALKELLEALQIQLQSEDLSDQVHRLLGHLKAR